MPGPALAGIYYKIAKLIRLVLYSEAYSPDHWGVLEISNVVLAMDLGWLIGLYPG
jgi:hypothetical protein